MITEVSVGNILICKYDKSQLEVTEITDKGFRYKNNTKLFNHPRLGIVDTGEGEIYHSAYYMYSKIELKSISSAEFRRLEYLQKEARDYWALLEDVEREVEELVGKDNTGFVVDFVFNGELSAEHLIDKLKIIVDDGS